MSNYGHYNQQYYGNHVDFPEESFTIKGISNYKENCEGIVKDSTITMKIDSDNIYDSSAIAIYFNDNIIGYVPNDNNIKKMCKENINDNLKIINIKPGKYYGIRVILESFYEYDPELESKAMFADS